LLSLHSRAYLTEKVQEGLNSLRQEILAGSFIGSLSMDTVLTRARAAIDQEDLHRLRPVVNATGTVLHTNLGRALLAREAIAEIVRAASHPVTLEYDLDQGGRGDRDRLIEEDLLALTGAEAATVVNNNAAAVLLALNTLAEGKEGIVSRGELIEIGGSFRIPDVMRKSGVILREVGTTNRTHRQDYEQAIGPNTGVLLKVHTSNYRIIGFTTAVNLEELVELGSKHGLPVMEDLGSGALIDLSPYNLPREPVVAERVAKGVDVVTFSGDKLLGGPQAGLMVGKKECLARIKQNPLKRALRPGKLTLAALSATLRLYRRCPDLAAELPTLRWLTRSQNVMETLGTQVVPLLRARLGEGFQVGLEDATSQIGSGALPEEEIPTKVIAIRHQHLSPEKIAERFRQANPPVLGRIKDNTFLLDLRGIFAPQELVPNLP
jgi:L-seryl-tRNA(Ser) seleniumtransferase